VQSNGASHHLRDMVSSLNKDLTSIREAALGDCMFATHVSALRSTGATGEAKVRWFNEILFDARLMMSGVEIFVNGFADCLEVAESRDMAVNIPALSATLRPAIEISAQICWILGDLENAGVETADLLSRRHFIWRFHDAWQQRNVFSSFRESADSDQAVTQAIRASEDDLVQAATEAGWLTFASELRTKNGKTHQLPAALARIDKPAERQKMPRITSMVRQLTGADSVYPLLSAVAHGNRFGLRQGLKFPGGDPKEMVVAFQSGFGIDPNVAILLACQAVAEPLLRLRTWTGVNIDSSSTQIRAIRAAARGGKTAS
jgi:hypothetical protein